MKQPIRALLLAAGLGTRLRPLTNTTPKCLVSVGGQTLLERWLENLEECGCSDVLVNTHYLADQVHNFLDKRPDSTMRIKSSYEPKLLGTAGTLLANQSFFEGSTSMLIHADNATNFKLKELIDAHQHKPKECILTMLTFDTDTPESCGIVEIDQNNIVKSFHEKVKNPPGNRANGAIYAFDQELLDTINQLGTGTTDLSTQVLPKLINKIYTKHTKQPFIDIGTPSALKKARKLWG